MAGNTRPFQRANDSPLSKEIAERIRTHGPVTVADYMAMALGHPEHGYYITQTAIGPDGDFTTAPEISQMFGEMIGAWLVDAWLQAGRPESIKLIELGPGKGTLAADILRTVSAWPEFSQAVSLHLVETSPRLRQMQFETLKDWHPTWYEDLKEVPVGPAFIVANEFFDALPVHQFEKTKEGWRERMIDWHEKRGEFFFTSAPLDFDVGPVMPKDFLDAPVGSVFELSPASLSVMDEVARRVAEYGGAALIIDYGHHQPGLGDTVQAVAKHKFSSPLENPGQKDITAHVDFATLAIVAQQRARVHGPVRQGEFLNALGIVLRAQKLAENATKAQRRDITAALHRLTAPSQMGGLFQVMGLTPKESAAHVPGFGEAEVDVEEEQQ
jgi:NADH dehydrogenase [ubiquinone] 1 alpha subcomplex assembly factor 7